MNFRKLASATVAFTLVTFLVISIPVFAQNEWLQFTDSATDTKAKPSMEFNDMGLAGVEIDYTFTAAELSTKEVDGTTYQYLYIDGFGKLGEVGKPALPMRNYIVAVPQGAEVRIEMMESKSEVHAGYLIHPALEPARDEVGAPEPEFVIDEEFYERDENYPESPVRVVAINQLRGIPLAQVQICPIQYNPGRRELTVFSHLKFRVEFVGGEGVFLDTYAHSPHFIQLLKNVVINNKSIPGAQIDVESESDGRSDIIIITHSSYVDAANTLAEWKEKMGYTVDVVSQASWTTTQVKDAIHSRYSSWSPKPDYFIIIGDHEDVPGEEKLTSDDPPEEYVTDLYYACMDGPTDYFPEMAHGRISVSSVSEANAVINKIIDYERNPTTTASFYTHGTTCALFQDRGDWTGSYYLPGDGYADRRFAQTSEEIHNHLISNGYTIDRIYDLENDDVVPEHWNNGYYANGEPIPAELLKPGFAWDGHTIDIINSVNDGRFILFHRDHGYVGGSGWASPSFTTFSMAGLANGDKLPVVFSINCHTGEFNLAECFAEKFLRYCGSGAAGVFAASYYSYSGWNDGLAEGFIDAIWPGLVPSFPHNPSPTVDPHPPMYTMGFVLNQGKIRMTETWGEGESENSQQYTFELFHYFGDPTMRIWTAVPQTITASHSNQITVGQPSFDISNASCQTGIVTIYYDGEIIGKGTLVSGACTIPLSPSPSTIGTAELTITSHNYRPYQTDIDVVAGAGADITVDPTSFDVTLPPNTTQDATLTIGNVGEGSLDYSISDRETTGEGSAVRSVEHEVLEPASMVLEVPLEGSPMRAENTGELESGWQDIMTEDFEGAFPPSGWTIIQYSGNGTWEQEAYGVDGYEPPGTGSYYAEADSDEHASYIFDTGLFTPSIDCSESANVSLAFARNFQDWLGCGYAEVVTYSGGTDFPDDLEESLWNQTLSDPSGGVNTTLYFDPSGYADPSNVYIEFYYTTEGDGYCWKFAIDDVVLSKMEAAEDCLWLDENPTSGTVEPGGSDNITVTINTTGLAEGDYTAEIVIANNDPDENPTIVPVTLHVTQQGPAVTYNLTISSTSGGSVTTPGEGTFTYNASEVVGLLATPDTNYTFVNWTGNVGTVANVNLANTTITMTGNYSIVANFAINRYNLTTSSSSGGNVTTPGEGVFGPYDHGTVVGLDATPDANYHFVNWTGDVGTVANVNLANTTITMTGNYSIVANFEELPPETYNLTISSTAGGSVTTPGEGTFTYNASEVVDLVATPDANYTFVNWTGDTDMIANENLVTTNITMNGNYTIMANFAEGAPAPVWSVGDNWVYNCSYENPGGNTSQDTCELEVTVVGEEAVGDEACYKCSGVFEPPATRDAADMPLTLHVETADIWTSKDHLEYVKMSSAIAELPGLPSTVTWNYTGDYGWPYEVGKTWNASVHVVAGVLDEVTELENKVLGVENITVPAGTFECYHVATYEPTSPDNYTFEHWFNATAVKSVVKEIDRFLWAGEETRELTSYSGGTPPEQYNLTISSTDGGNVTIPGEGKFTYNASEVVNLVATPDSGYHFVNWTGHIDTIADANSRITTITMNGDYSITANFAEGAVEVDSEWGKVDTPYREDWTIAPNSDILVPATIGGGEVIYVVGKGYEDNNMDEDWGQRLWKSDDSGVIWDDLADNVWDADGLPANFNSGNSDVSFNYVACGQDDSDFVAVALVDDNGTASDYSDDEQAVVISDDGGDEFAWTGDIIDGAATLTRAFDMKISDEDNDKRNIILGGTGDAGSYPDGLVFRYETGGLTGGRWVDASAYDGWDNINDTAAVIDSDAVTTAQFAKSWLADNTVLVVSHTADETYLQSGTWGNSKCWNEPAGFEPAVLVVNDPSNWPMAKGTAAGLAQPTDYEGRHASSRYVWVYVNNVNSPYEGIIYRVTNGAVIEVNMQISGKPWLASVSYLGTIDEGEAIAGLLGDGTGYPTECCEGVQVYFNDGIVDMDICCERWSDACKPPTGTWTAMVGYATPNKAYAFVGGLGYEFEEGAMSFSLDDGDTWNQLGLVDTYVNYLSDVAKSADCNKTWVVSVNAEQGDGGCECDSVWLKADPLPDASEYSGAWIREWCEELEGDDNGYMETGLLRLAPEETEEALTVYLVDRGTYEVYYDSNKGLGCWETGSSTVDQISDLAVQDEATIYAVGWDADVAVSDDHGSAASWSSTMDSKVDVGHTIAVLGEGNVLVGSEEGKVAYSDDNLSTFLDGDASFTELEDIGDGDVHVAFDSYFDSNSVIYAAVGQESPANDADNGIYRWVIGESSNWKDLGECAGTATPTETQLCLGPSCDTVEVGYYGIVLSNADGNPETDATTGGVLYAAFYDAAGNITGVARCLNPAEEVACGEAIWDYLIEDVNEYHGAFTLEPSSLKICGCLTLDTNSKLWAVDDNWYYHWFATDREDSDVGRLWTYEDCYAKSAPVLVAPADGAGVSCDPYYWWNDAFALEWDRQCDASSYNIQIAYDEDFTGLVLDISGKNSDCQEIDYEPPSGSSPSYLVAEGALGPGSCGTTFYWRVRSADAETGEIIHSPWSEARSFTVAGEPKYYNLTISSTSGGNVTTPGEGTFTCNASEVVELVATPDANYTFVNWTGDTGTIDDVNATTTNITMTANYSIMANFAVGEGWGFEIQPDVTTVGYGGDFSINATVTRCSGNSTAWHMYLLFNTTYLEVTGIDTPNTLPTGDTPDVEPGMPVWNNTRGWAQHGYSRSVAGPEVNTGFVYCTIHFHSKSVNGTTNLNFTVVDPAHQTDILDPASTDVLNWAHVVNGTVEVVPGATLQGNVTFPGRGIPPDDRWIEDFVVRFFQGSSEVRSDNVTTNSSGYFNISGIAPGTYDIRIKGLTSVSKLESNVTFVAGETVVVDFGTIREGDCNGDNWITGADRNLLYTGWGSHKGGTGWNPDCDLNADGWLTGADRNLMYTYWGQHGD